MRGEFFYEDIKGRTENMAVVKTEYLKQKWRVFKAIFVVVNTLLVLTFFMPAVAVSAAAQSGAGTFSVFVGIAPQAFFIKRIGGDRVQVSVLLPPGKSPATYAPTPAQMTALSRASLLFVAGLPFEQTLIPKIKAMAPGLVVVDTDRGIALRSFSRDESLHDRDGGNHAATRSSDHQDGMAEAGHDHHDHGVGAKDPHIWMSPRLVRQQARTMCDALSMLAPEQASFFEKNLKDFQQELTLLDERISAKLAPFAGETIFVFHPVFGYFADAYGLKQLAVEQGGKTPKGKDLVAFIQLAKKNSVRVIFVQPQFDQRVARKIASRIGGAVVVVDPLARNYMENLSHMADVVNEALER